MSQSFFEISTGGFQYDAIGLSNFISNGIFLTLFISMTLYWIEIAFFKTPGSSNFLKLTEPVSASTNNSTIAITATEKKLLQINSRLFLIIGNFLLVVLLVLRWQISGHFPLSNLYESLIFLSWCCTFLHLIMCQNLGIYIEKIVGAVISPSALLLTAFANFTLPKEMQQAAPLVPALQSNWLMMHVTVMIISYATLIVGSLLSIAFLILYREEPEGVNFFGSSSKETKKTLSSNTANLISNLDYLSYRIIGLGFPFLTIGILSGAVWANEAWGSYWSWDPKETWALLTWLVFAIYLHTRLNSSSPTLGDLGSSSDVKATRSASVLSSLTGVQTSNTETLESSSGIFSQKSLNQELLQNVTLTKKLNKKPAIIASLGFFVVWFCYLGVNLLGEGLHSYGFFA